MRTLLTFKDINLRVFKKYIKNLKKWLNKLFNIAYNS
jgi:hypothetical protein